MPDPLSPKPPAKAVDLDATQSSVNWDTNSHRPGAGQADDIDVRSFLKPAQGEGEPGRLGRYRILKLLGHGAMGIVLLAEDVNSRRPVAIKIMLPHIATKTQARVRFLREAQFMAMLNHDNIVTIFEVGEENGVPFIAMQLLEGQPLDQHLKDQGELPLGQAVRIGREIAEGLQAVHANGLIHVDIEPANIWLEDTSGRSGQWQVGSGQPEKTDDREPNGLDRLPTAHLPLPTGSPAAHFPLSTFRVKILDFGLARLESDESHITNSRAFVGTPAYVSPEQARGRPLDARSDLFSLGVVLYRLCTGQQPFTGPTTMAVLTSLAIETPTPVRQLNPNVPIALEQLIHRLLAKDREQRPASAKEVVAALAKIEQPAGTGQPNIVGDTVVV